MSLRDMSLDNSIRGKLGGLPVKANKYHDYECCEWTRGVDTLLLRYQNDRNEVCNLIKDNPNHLVNTIWKPEGPLAIDNGCLCRMGCGDRRTPFACAQCKNLRRLIDLRSGGVDRPFKLECGETAGKNLIVTRVDVPSSFLAWDNESAHRAKFYLHQYKDLARCGTPNIPNLKCITGDPFTIETLITWMISQDFANKGLPHIQNLHTAFICSGSGYSVYDVPSIGNINNLSEAYRDSKQPQALNADVARSIIVQLLVILSELSHISFSHGTPSIDGLVFNKSPVSYRYDGHHVVSPVTLQLTNLKNSSATFNSIHFFPKNVKSSVHIEQNMFVPEIATRTVSMAHCEKDLNSNVCDAKSATLYRLTSGTLDIFNAMRHIGFPLYVGSFDFYCFMVSLMSNKSFYNAVMNDKKLYRLWSMMWLAEDLPRIEAMIKESHETPISNVSIIRGAWLRCDIVKYIWNLIKMGW